MAEIFGIMRGHADHVDKTIRSLKAQFFPMKFKKKMKDEFGKEFEVEVIEEIEAQYRPYQLFGYVVPDEFVQPVCNQLGIPTDETWFNTGPKEGGTGNSFISGKGIKFYLEALRLLLGAEKIPKQDLSKGIWNRPIYHSHVNILGIGWHPDGKIKTSMGEHDAV